MVSAFGASTLDTERYELRRAGTVCPLEPHAVDILTYFLQHPERVVTKRELLEQLWPGRFVADGILAQRIMTIRKAIGDSGKTQQCIETVRGRGYRFAAEVSVHPTARRMDAFSPTTVAPDQRGRGDRASPAPGPSPGHCASPLAGVGVARDGGQWLRARRSATSAFQPPATLRR